MHSNIKKDYTWNTIGVFMQNLISPLLLIVVTRLNGVDDAGLFSFAISIALIFWAFSIWGGRTYQVSDTKKEFSAQSYVLVRIILSATVFIAALVFCYINNYDLIKTSIIAVLVIYKTIESIADAIYGILQVNGRLYVAGKSLLYKSLLGIAFFFVIDQLTHNILISSIGLVVANTLVLAVYDIPKARRFESIWAIFSRQGKYTMQALEIIRRCAPIASVIFMSMFSLLIPRYFVDIYHQDQIGYFGILAMPITALGLLITFIIQPNVVSLSTIFSKQNYKEFESIVRKIFLVTSLLSILILPVVYLVGTDVLTIVFGVDFSLYQLALFVFVLGAIANAFVTIYINLLTIMRHFKIQFYTLVITNILLVVACLFVVPTYSLLGSVLLYLSVNILQVVFLVVAYKKALSDDAKTHITG